MSARGITVANIHSFLSHTLRHRHLLQHHHRVSPSSRLISESSPSSVPAPPSPPPVITLISVAGSNMDLPSNQTKKGFNASLEDRVVEGFTPKNQTNSRLLFSAEKTSVKKAGSGAEKTKFSTAASGVGLGSTTKKPTTSSRLAVISGKTNVNQIGSDVGLRSITKKRTNPKGLPMYVKKPKVLLKPSVEHVSVTLSAEKEKNSVDVPLTFSPEKEINSVLSDVNQSLRSSLLKEDASCDTVKPTPPERLPDLISVMKQSLVRDLMQFINSANREGLEDLKSIGPTIANNILESRENSSEPFASLEDLHKVGLKPKQVQKMLKDLLDMCLGLKKHATRS